MNNPRPSALVVYRTHLRVAAAAAWRLTKYWWVAHRNASPAALGARLGARSSTVVPAWLPSQRVVGIVARVARLHPLRPECLPQALTVCDLLLSAGRTASVRLGVDREHGQLRAHAWVQAADLRDDQRNRGFLPLGDIPPGP